MKLSTSTRLQWLRVSNKEVIKESRLVIETADGYQQQRVYADDRRPDERLSTKNKGAVLVPAG
jgi:5-deoxy-D-glucuronate isomerase